MGWSVVENAGPREGKLAWVITLQISPGLFYELNAKITTTQKFSKFSTSKRCNNETKNIDSRLRCIEQIPGLGFSPQYQKTKHHNNRNLQRNAAKVDSKVKEVLK